MSSWSSSKLAGSAGLPLMHLDGSTNASGDLGRSCAQLGQPALMDFLVAIAFGNALAADLLPCRQMAERCDQTLELQYVGILLTQFRRGWVRAVLQDAGILAGIHGKAMIVIGHIEFAALLVKNKL